MNDVNYDEFEPVGSPDGGTYSTARPTRKHNVGLAIAVSLLVIILCGAMTIVSLFSVRIEREEGATSVIFTERNPDITAAPMEEQPPAPPEQVAGDAFEPAETARPFSADAMSLTEIYSKLEPSVVSVICTTAQDSAVERSGVILSEEGYVVTSCSIVRNTGAISVLLHDGTEYTASIVGGDALSDLAVVKIEAEGLVPAEFGDSDALRVGEEVLSIGDPRGWELRAAMTDGIVSGISRDLDVDGRTMTIVQTNASLPAGGSGGPLVNMRGQVVGINAESIGSFSGGGSLGLVVPVDNAKNIVDELIEHGYIPGRPSLGLSGQVVTDAAQAYYRLPAGTFVDKLEAGGAAERAGLEEGDIITAVDGAAVDGPDALNRIINRYKSGDTVTVTVFRDGEERNYSLVLGLVR